MSNSRATPSILHVGSAKQLFIDHRFIERSENVTLRVNPPAKKGLVLDAHEPWDVCGCYLHIFQDAGLVKAFYDTHMHGDGMKQGRLCYAESRDGIHFDKPRLGIVDFNGSRDNNIVFPDVLDASPFLDPNAPPSERWKLIYCYGYPGIPRELKDFDKVGVYMAVSPDGLHWTKRPGRLLPLLAETHKIAHWDPARRKYLIYLRVINMQSRARWRMIGRIETDDITRPWPCPIAPERPKYLSNYETPMVFTADDQDPPDTDVYAASPQPYPGAADAWVMFPTFYRHTPPPVGIDANDGPLSTQFACSRDGITWTRPERTPYIRPGLDTEFDRGYNMIGAGMAFFGDKIYQYYAAKGGTHHGRVDDLPDPERRKVARNAYVRLEQRLDGFVSADAAYTGGTLTTPLIDFTGAALELNIDAESLGSARVEIRDRHDQPLPGFSLADCDPVAGNSVRRKVTWKGAPDLRALARRPLRLHFDMRATKLYALQFV